MADRARRWLSGDGTRQGPRIFTSTSSATTRPVRSAAVRPIAMAHDPTDRAFRHSFGDVAADNLRYGPRRPAPDPPMLYRRILEILLMTAVCVASGTLECSHPRLSETQAHGRDVYVRMCAVCHGRGGEGYSADQAPALAQPDFLASVSDDYLR